MNADKLLDVWKKREVKLEAELQQIRSAICYAEKDLSPQTGCCQTNGWQTPTTATAPVEIVPTVDTSIAVTTAPPRPRRVGRPSTNGSPRERIPMADRVQQVRDYLQHHGTVKRSQIASDLGMSVPTLSMVLNQPDFASPSWGHWALASAVPTTD